MLKCIPAFGILPTIGPMEHSLDNGDGPPCLQVKPCTPEFYQAHYQLVSLHNFKESGGE